MALDGLLIHFLRQELSDALVGGRVDKIHQPAREDVTIQLRTRAGQRRLLLSAGAASPRAHLTAQTAENPKTPPMFCQLLRKHIGNGRLAAIRQPDLERVLYFDFEAVNEIGDKELLTLACEMMGRRSNLILIRDGQVIDAVKRVGRDMSSVRPVLPGMDYRMPPPQDKLSALSSFEEIAKRLQSLPEKRLPDALLGGVQGLSPLLCREIAGYVTRGADHSQKELSGEEWDRLRFFLHELQRRVEEGTPEYTAVLDAKTGKPVEYSFLPLRQYGAACLSRTFGSASELLDFFYDERDRQDRMRQRSHDLLRLLVQTTERVSRRMAAQREELAATADRQTYRLYGELIQAQLYDLQKGQSSAELYNYYDNTTVTVPLRPQDTPVENAQWYFKQYRKACAAEEKLTSLLAESEQELSYLDSVFDAVSRTTGESELLEIREELSEQGYLKHYKNKNKMLRPRPPLSYRSSDGFLILCGRNNKQNDELTLRRARGSDIWLHVQKASGSHVIVVTEGKTPPDRTLTEAAELAAYHSKARESGQVPVDYTEVRNVKKPNGARPGMVIFDRYKTAFVTPREALTPEKV